MVKKRSKNGSKKGVVNEQTLLPLPNDSLYYEAKSGYLHSCYQCENNFDLTQDIYMYRDLAFCSIECRDAKIAIDTAAAEHDIPKQGI